MSCRHAATVDHPQRPDDVDKRLDKLSRDRGNSLTLVLNILTESVDTDARRARLERYAAWTDDEAASLDNALTSQRDIDVDLGR